MKILVVGANFEENLGLGMVVAAAQAAGHCASPVPFNHVDQLDAVAHALVAERPDAIGLSIQFQHRAFEFLALSRRLRTLDYRGHITCGGQFPTLAYRELLTGAHGVDTVVLHEAEQSLPELLDALEAGRPVAEVSGIALLSDDGVAMRTPGRPLVADLDEFSWPVRYRRHERHMGVSFIPIIGSRGCWGACTYCSITAFGTDARNYAGGRLVRYRSPENIAAEMAQLWHATDGDAVFCFHDDNFLMPRPQDSLARVRAIRAALDRHGVGDVGMIGKCRPDCITAELAQQLAELGVVRLYVGVENVSDRGAEHLNRARQAALVHQALEACREAGIFGCYNLLVFEPGTHVDDVEQNVAFIRAHPSHPVNFCRAEAYHGTALHRQLQAAGRIGGSYLGYDYRIKDDQAELLFRICAAAFRQRNFAPQGVHNRMMGLGYNAKLLQRFCRHESGRALVLATRAETVTRSITLETADFLDEAIALARSGADHDRISRETVLLGLRIAHADRARHVELDELYRGMGRVADSSRKRRWVPTRVGQLAQRAAQVAAFGSVVAATSSGVGCFSDTADPVPTDASVDGMVADPLPWDASVDGTVDDPLPPDASVADPVPWDASADGTVDDPLPPDASVDGMVADPLPADNGQAGLHPGGHTGQPLIDQWRNVTPRRAVRSDDLPLFDPPDVRLRGRRVAGELHVSLQGGPEQSELRWDADGEVTTDGRDAIWRPLTPDDQLRVAVRSHGGVAVASIRARDI